MKAKSSFRINRIHPVTNGVFNLLFVLLAASAILPVVLVFMISISSEESIRLVGYSFFPAKLSLEAYEYIWMSGKKILKADAIFMPARPVDGKLRNWIMSTRAQTKWNSDSMKEATSI